MESQSASAESHFQVGIKHSQAGQIESAIASWQTAIALQPNLVEAHYNLGTALLQQGQTEQAIASFQTALDLNPDYHLARLSLVVSQLPIIYTAEAEIESKRHEYQQQLESLADYYEQANEQQRSAAAMAVGSNQPFYLAYQGMCDRDLQQTYGGLIQRLMASRYAQWSQPLGTPKLAAQQKIRVGFVSGFFNHHSVWKIILQGWVENLDRSEFELFAYFTGNKRDEQTARAAKSFERFEHNACSVDQWAEKIAQDNLHVLIFPEFGMDTMAVQLGCLRLAPVQIASWGHPETSGLPTIDYFLSSDLMESTNAQSHYTEKLVKLPNLGVCYQPIPIKPEAVARKDLGILESDIMFWCCQSLFKYLPQHDDVFPRIAQAVSNAKFVFIKLESKLATNVFCQRLADAFQKFNLNYQDYCIFLPLMSANAFAGVGAIADIYLDNIGWSGGNTTLESTVYNLPIVTLPGELMRSRHTLAILKMMGIEETIAHNKDEYVQIATRLGQDRDYRHHSSQQIALNKYKCYGDLKPVRALEDFLMEIVEKPSRFDSADIKAAFQLAEQHYQNNRLEKAQQQYSQVLAVQPKHAEALYAFGSIEQQKGNLTSAEQYFCASVQAQPNFLKAWFSLGNLRQAQGQFSTAEQAYRQALNLRPDSAPIYNNLGYVLQQQNKWSAAASCYQQALQLMPNCLEADVNWGNALFAQGKLSPEKQAHYAKLNYKLGLGRQRVGDGQTAEIYYLQAISMQPDLVEAHYDLGSILHQQTKLDQALNCYQQVLQLDPNFGKAYYSLGQVYQDLSDLVQATASFKRGLQLINPAYAKAILQGTQSVIAASPNLATVADNYTVPPIPSGTVTIGGHEFPAIPPVSEAGKRPFWSVVIPVVNRPEYFPECLASVLSQWTGAEEMEIIVLDNGSDPPQWQIPDDLGRGIVRYYRLPETIPLQENWNTAVSLCRGEWIHLLHNDDYVLPGFYEQLKTSLATCPDSVGVAFTGYQSINDNRQILYTEEYDLENYRGIVQDWVRQIGVVNATSPPSIVIKRASYEKLGGYKLDILFTCDWELYKRIASFSDWWYEPGILAHYRRQANSVTITENLNGASGYDHLRAIEISESYLPAKYCAEITAKSRVNHFLWCLDRANTPLKSGNLDSTLQLLQAALKIDRSSGAIAELSRWLQAQIAAPLLKQLAQLEIDSEETEQNILLNLARTIFYNREKDILS
ncbi:MAG: hypothetical protein RLZZ535_1161 [Cyanobacteriota bacterium]